ncbi:F-box/LRR-repeat protein 6 [Stigmatopora argus]
MASTDGAVKDAGACTSSEGSDQANVSVKRKSTKAKRPNVKKPRVNRVSYTIHQGEDMLLVIPNSTTRYDDPVWAPNNTKRGKKKKVSTQKSGRKSTPAKKEKRASIICTTADRRKEPRSPAPAFVSTMPNDHRWGQNLPGEVLVSIFQMVVMQDGAVPFLCRVGRVCRSWNAAAATPVLWRKVSVGHCWVAPGKSQLPKTHHRIKDTFSWLAQNRFSQLQDFSLHHWKTNVDYAVDVVSQSCPHLNALTLSYCTGLTPAAFQSLGLHAGSLRSLNVQYTEVEGLAHYLESHGAQIQKIWFTHGPKNNRLLAAITRKCCPNLELLEVNTMLDSQNCELRICTQALQSACPKLKTFRMMNVSPLHKNVQISGQLHAGFPLLEELCIATTSYSYMTDKYLQDILFGSPRLRVLDLRGCTSITSDGLLALPCLDLECLFWGQYFSSNVLTSCQKQGIYPVAQKWSHTLRQLDVANQPFSEAELEMAVGHLAGARNSDSLRSLNLSGTRITTAALRAVIGQSTALNYLNLSSCRYLPRGLKRIYRGQEDIRRLLDKLE